MGGSVPSEIANKAIIIPTGSGSGLKILAKNAPAAPYRVAIAMSRNFTSDRMRLCAGFRDPDTGRLNVLLLTSDTLFLQTYSDPNTFTGSSTTIANIASRNIWYGLRNDGTSLIYEVSYDGVHWVALASQALSGNYLANPSQVWVGTNVNDTSSEAVVIRAWDEDGLNRVYNTASKSNVSGTVETLYLVPLNPPTAILFPFEQNSSGVTASVSENEKFFNFTRTDGGPGGDTLATRTKALPSGTSWTVTAGIRTPIYMQGFLRRGLVLLNSSTGQYILFCQNTQNGSPVIDLFGGANLSVYSNFYGSVATNNFGVMDLMMRITSDATDYVFSISSNYGLTWRQVATVAKSVIA